jgi:hypothetical protein
LAWQGKIWHCVGEAGPEQIAARRPRAIRKRISMQKILFPAVLAALLLSLHPTAALAYIGPGVGAGAIAAVLGVIGSIFLAIVGVLYYPIKRLLKGRKSKTAKSSGGSKPAA